MELKISAEELISVFAEVLGAGYHLGMEQNVQMQFATSDEEDEDLEEENDDVVDIKFICPSCGIDVKYLENYCSNCGTKIEWE